MKRPTITLTRRRLLAMLTLGGVARAQPAAREVEVVARRFQFTPQEIALKRGEAVTLAFTAIDFVHGFSVPDLKLRADLMPGRVTRVVLPPLAAGRFDFLCDNFCGDGHETMHGVLVVVD